MNTSYLKYKLPTFYTTNKLILQSRKQIITTLVMKIHKTNTLVNEIIQKEQDKVTFFNINCSYRSKKNSNDRNKAYTS